MLVNTERFKFRTQEEADVVMKLATMLEGKVDLINLRRQSTAFGAQARSYKAKKKNGQSTLDFNLGAWSTKHDNLEQIVTFISSERVQKFFSK